MEAVLDHVVLDHPLSWNVTERVVAEWTDDDLNRRRQLGTLNTKTNSQSGPNLTLAVGHRHDSLLILLHMAIKLRPSTGSKPKHMFFVLPTGSLLRPPVCQVLDPSQVPETILCAAVKQAKSEAVESGAPSNPKRVIKMRVQLKDPGYVIMPHTTIERQIQGSPRRLLEDLRSLSDSLSFDIYLRFNTFAEVGLRHAARMVQDGPVTTPTVHIHRMFNGVGATAAWDQYLLPPSYKANPPVDSCKHVQVLVPRSSEASPSRDFFLANAHDDGVIKETPPPPPPLPPPPQAIPPTPPRIGKRKATSPPPASDDLVDGFGSFCNLLCLWLEWAWTILPDAHEVIRDDLIALGRAICAADQTIVDGLRAQCTKCIIFTATDRSLVAGGSKSQQPRQQQRDLETEFQDLVQWINHADRFADMVLSPKLFALAKAENAVALKRFHLKGLPQERVDVEIGEWHEFKKKLSDDAVNRMARFKATVERVWKGYKAAVSFSHNNLREITFIAAIRHEILERVKSIQDAKTRGYNKARVPRMRNGGIKLRSEDFLRAVKELKRRGKAAGASGLRELEPQPLDELTMHAPSVVDGRFFQVAKRPPPTLGARERSPPRAELGLLKDSGRVEKRTREDGGLAGVGPRRKVARVDGEKKAASNANCAKGTGNGGQSSWRRLRMARQDFKWCVEEVWRTAGTAEQIASIRRHDKADSMMARHG
ncbi:hypothetical protein BC567DRAFT_268351 [Phyllosticta citribraziliensis]